MSQISDRERINRLYRQDLKALEMFGVDFVPLGSGRGRSATSHQEPAEATQQAVADHREPIAASDKASALEALRHRHDTTCPHCTAATTHTQCVFGEGDPDASIMFIGEAPGEEEDRTGRPFVGRAGQLLDKIIQAMGLKREEVYIANVLKSRPPNNRTPLAPEIDACGPFLAEQIRIIRPQVIVTLGGPATKLMLGTDIGITKLRGQWAEYHDEAAEVTVPVMPTFHPAYLLRNYTPDARGKVWADMQEVLQRVGLPVPARENPS